MNTLAARDRFPAVAAGALAAPHGSLSSLALLPLRGGMGYTDAGLPTAKWIAGVDR